MNGTISTNAASLHGIGGMTWNELALNDVAMHRNEVVNDFRAHGNILAWKKKSVGASKEPTEDIEHFSDDSMNNPISKSGQAALKRSSVQIPSDED